MPSVRPARTRIQRLGSQRARDIRASTAEAIRRAREDAGLSQRALAQAAGVGSATVNGLERGSHDPGTEVLARVTSALGLDLSVKLYPGTGPPIRDHLQAAMIGALIAALHERWRPQPEVAVYRPVRGVIDLVLEAVEQPPDMVGPAVGVVGPPVGVVERLVKAAGAPHGTIEAPPRSVVSSLVAVEAHSDLRRIEQQLRWAGSKADALSQARRQPVSCLLLLRSTRRTRALAAEYQAVLRASYPARTGDALAALAGTRRWPGSALAWCVVRDGRARLLPTPPRGVSLGR